jgi:hypothetical protein
MIGFPAGMVASGGAGIGGSFLVTSQLFGEPSETMSANCTSALLSSAAMDS